MSHGGSVNETEVRGYYYKLWHKKKPFMSIRNTLYIVNWSQFPRKCPHIKNTAFWMTDYRYILFPVTKI